MDKRYTSSDLDIAEIKKDISYIKETTAAIDKNLTSGYTPLSEFNALRERVDLIFRAVFFLIALLVASASAALFKLIYK